MKKLEVRFRARAEADLLGLYEYIAAEAGLDIAGAYIDRIETACLALENFPERGTRRDDIRPGLRTMGFERRITIVFRVSRATVEIVRSSMADKNTNARCAARPTRSPLSAPNREGVRSCHF